MEKLIIIKVDSLPGLIENADKYLLPPNTEALKWAGLFRYIKKSEITPQFPKEGN